jgi:hypothetical protein
MKTAKPSRAPAVVPRQPINHSRDWHGAMFAVSALVLSAGIACILIAISTSHP